MLSRYPNNVVQVHKNPKAVIDLCEKGEVRDLFIVDDNTTCVVKKRINENNNSSLYNPVIMGIYIQAYNRQYLREEIEKLYIQQKCPGLDSWLFHNTDSLILKTDRETKFESQFEYGAFKNQLPNASEFLGYSAFSATQYSLLFDTIDEKESEICHYSGFKSTCEEKIAYRDFEDIVKSIASNVKKQVKFNQTRRKRRKLSRPYKCSFSISTSRVSRKRYILPKKLFTVPFGISAKIRAIIEKELPNRI